MNSITIYNMPKEVIVDKILSAYTGKPNTCMCGCAGEYVYPKINQVKAGENRGYEVRDNEVNDKRVARILQNFIKNAEGGIEVIPTSEKNENGGYSETFIFTMVLGKTQYTLYV